MPDVLTCDRCSSDEDKGKVNEYTAGLRSTCDRLRPNGADALRERLRYELEGELDAWSERQRQRGWPSSQTCLSLRYR